MLTTKFRGDLAPKMGKKSEFVGLSGRIDVIFCELCCSCRYFQKVAARFVGEVTYGMQGGEVWNKYR
jgi:hypothetical protein